MSSSLVSEIKAKSLLAVESDDGGICRHIQAASMPCIVWRGLLLAARNTRFHDCKTFGEWCRIVRAAKCLPHTHSQWEWRLQIRNLFIHIKCMKVDIYQHRHRRQRQTQNKYMYTERMEEKRSASDLKLKTWFCSGPTKKCERRQPMSTFFNDDDDDENTGDECSDDMLEGIIYPLLVWCHIGMDGILSLS